MEMTYNGTLTMPANFAALDAEEMTYVEGGMHIVKPFNSGYEARAWCNGYATDLWGIYFSGVAVGGILGANVVGTFASIIPGAGTIVGSIIGGVLGAWGASVLSDVISDWAKEWGNGANNAERRGWKRTTVDFAWNSLTMSVNVY